MQKELPLKSMPDVAQQSLDLELSGSLDWVGMTSIEVPVRVGGFLIPARACAFVDLHKEDARGIHMSRLFKEVQNTLPQENLSFHQVEEILKSFLDSHEGLSTSAALDVEFEAPLQRESLKSAMSAWRSYPVKLSSQQKRGKRALHTLEVLVTYSSTCPASAALSRQLIQENFKKHFRQKDLDFKEVVDWLGSTQGINATAHAQRSYARVKVEVLPSSGFFYENLIGVIEDCLKTPVQALVKREDEQEFALRNGQNLMFCEDAGRRVKKALDETPEILDFFAELRHAESLHPHDAVSYVSKGKLMRSF